MYLVDKPTSEVRFTLTGATVIMVTTKYHVASVEVELLRLIHFADNEGNRITTLQLEFVHTLKGCGINRMLCRLKNIR
jgi:hypothetical protein